MSWVEARLKRESKPRELYDWLGEEPRSVHHFWDEPWWDGAYVVRVLDPEKDLTECPAVDHIVQWDDQPDSEAYGEYWPFAARFFEAGSMLSLSNRPKGQFVHCYLNAQGMSEWQEAKFALRFAWGRLTIRFRWWLYLRRRWERDQGPPVKDEA